MEWVSIERPGHFGKNRDQKYREFNDVFGEGNWRIVWHWKNDLLSFPDACKVYEKAYFIDSIKRESLWLELIKEASDVYDYQESDVESGLDYLIQKAHGTHLQDIAIRRVIKNRAWRFKGNKLVQVRGHKTYWGGKLSPGKIPFHNPEYITNPHLEAWWDANSIEDFWQSNKVLQIVQSGED